MARIALVLHAGMLIASGIAFATFLAPPSPEWLDAPANRHIASLMFRYGGQATVILGAIAGIAHAVSRLGARAASKLFVAAFGISLLAELAGTTTGYPFGPYGYTTQLGYLVGGRVPFNIPTSWFFMLYASLGIVGSIASPSNSAGGKLRWAALVAIVLTAWDVSMDPAMVATTHWLWHLPHSTSPSFVERMFLSDLFYGMPLTNWLGWLVTGFIIARVMLCILPSGEWATKVSTSRLPVVLYAVNGVFPILICAGRGMWLAVAFGALAMGIPLTLAVRRRSHARVAQPFLAPAPAAN